MDQNPSTVRTKPTAAIAPISHSRTCEANPYSMWSSVAVARGADRRVLNGSGPPGRLDACTSARDASDPPSRRVSASVIDAVEQAHGFPHAFAFESNPDPTHPGPCAR